MEATLQIECEKDSLLELSQIALRVVTPRANTPALGGIRLTAGENNLELAASDLETFVTIAGTCSVVEPGAVVVPGRLFGEILRSLPPGRVTLAGGENGIRVEGGRAEFSLSTFPVADFARPPSGEVGEPFSVGATDLARALKQVGRAASTDEGRPVLTGILWFIEAGALRLVATDSYRLAVAEVVVKEGSYEGQSIIPNRALAEFGRHLMGSSDEVAHIELGKSQAVLSAGRVRLVTRLIEGEFPNWRRLMPESHRSQLEVDHTEFAAAVARVGLVAQANTPVRFHLGSEVQLTAQESGVAEAAETVEGANYQGEPMVTAFNPKFFLDGMEGIDGQTAVLELNEPTKPATLRAKDQYNFTYLVMPVRLPH
ncbi:MAG: DNA polymerase III subunit beta [Actinomycetota bacterium]